MKICYFGIYDPDFGRNVVYMSGLKENGHEVIECRDTSPGVSKFWQLWKKHRQIISGGAYDVMIIGYPGHIVVPFAKIISRAPVVFDALSSLYEGEVLSRGKYKYNPLMLFWINLIDKLAVKFADLILVETNAQKHYFIKRFSVKRPEKIVRVFTGADDKILYPDPNVQKTEKFTAVFRGKFLPEAGVEYIFEAAKILEHEDIHFIIMGHGYLEKEIKEKYAEMKLKNLELIREFLPWEKVREKMLACHVSLGQFGMHDRLDRTIPHKAFETLALKLPYLTGRRDGVRELLTEGKDCFMVNCADPDDLAAKLIFLKNNRELAENVAENGYRLFKEKLTPKKLSADIVLAVNMLRQVD